MSAEEADMARVRRVMEQLGEHFDSVQIFVTRHEPGQEGGTVNLNMGCGNWFARYGQTKDWLVREEERTRNNMREESN